MFMFEVQQWLVNYNTYIINLKRSLLSIGIASAWSILLPFRKTCDHLEHFTYICHLGIFFPVLACRTKKNMAILVLVCRTKKNLATLVLVCRTKKNLATLVDVHAHDHRRNGYDQGLRHRSATLRPGGSVQWSSSLPRERKVVSSDPCPDEKRR
jgi:hypothetical protein